MKKIYVLLFAIISYSYVFSQTQTTVTFKPGPDIGQDASLYSTGNCLPNGYTQLPANINYSTEVDMRPSAWTWNSVGCPTIDGRSLLRFDELSTIPADAAIINAELKLYGLHYHGTVGNSCYSGSPYSNYCPNRSFIQRVTSAWDIHTVTWNTQPTTTTVNQITIPPTTLQWSWNFTDHSDNLVAMVQDMVAHPVTNFGFMIKLETEVYYRSMIFASSDHPDPTLWPELTVTYEHCLPEIIVITDTVFTYETIVIRDTVVVYDPVAVYDTVYVQNPCPFKARNNIIKVYPNPTESGWTVKITIEEEETIKIQLSDMVGKIIYSDIKSLISGENSFVIDARSLSTGGYNLRMTGETISFSETLLKK